MSREKAERFTLRLNEDKEKERAILFFLEHLDRKKYISRNRFIINVLYEKIRQLEATNEAFPEEPLTEKDIVNLKKELPLLVRTELIKVLEMMEI